MAKFNWQKALDRCWFLTKVFAILSIMCTVAFTWGTFYPNKTAVKNVNLKLDKFYMKKGGKVQYWGESKIPRVNSNLLFKDLMQHLREGKEIPMDYGLDGMRNVLKSVMMENKMLNPEEINMALSKGASQARKVANEVLLRVRKNSGY